MFLKRSVQEIIRDASLSISENSPITNFHAGSIARSIVEAIAPEIGSGNEEGRESLYDFALKILDEGFLSKATGQQLDLIGGLFSYHRRIEQVRDEFGNLTEEAISDDMYRYEISQVVPSMATANYAAIRLALLTIQGVQDVIGKEYSHGTGSFSFLLIPQFGFNEEEVATQMEEALSLVKAFGVRAHIELPIYIPVDLTIQLSFHETASDIEKVNIRSEVESRLTEYIGLHELGQSFVMNDLIQEVMNVNERIIDFEITRFSLNNEPVLLMNQEVADDERFQPQNIQVL